MKTMTGFDIFEKMTNVNDKFIEEAAEMPDAEEEVVYLSPWKRLGNFINSGWGVAIICLLVATAVTVGIIAAGQMAEPITPLPGAGDTHPNFSFAYTLQPEQDTYLKGDTITIRTEVKNLGAPFAVSGSSQTFSAYGWLIPHGSTDIYNAEGKINGSFAMTDDYVTRTIKQGDIGRITGHFTIPVKDGTEGEYDLVLSYKGEYQIFEKAITVVRINTPPSPVPDGIEFSVPDHLERSVYDPGETVSFSWWLRGLDHFMTPDQYALSATLLRSDTQNGLHTITGTVEWDTFRNLANSNMTWAYYTVTFQIPEDAAEGSYDLYLFFMSRRENDDTAKEEIKGDFLSVSGTHPHFDFDYSIQPHTTTFLLGNSYKILTSITNIGDPFTIQGCSKSFSAKAKLVHHTSPGIELECHFSYPEDEVTWNIATGDKGTHYGYFTIPEDAYEGAYDLHLYYGEEYQVFEKAIHVEDPTTLPLLHNIRFSDTGILDRLKGFSLMEYRHRWGEPDISLSDGNSFLWEIPNDADYLTVRFSEDGLAEEITHTAVMKATVTEKTALPSLVTATPCEGERELASGKLFTIPLDNTPQSVIDALEVGTVIYVPYDGMIYETYPCGLGHVGAVSLTPPAVPPLVTKEEATDIAEAHMQKISLSMPLDELHFRISESTAGEYYYVSYTYLLGGYPTDYKFTLKIGFDGVIRDYEPSTWDPEAYYATYTHEEVKAARDRLHQRMKDELGKEDLPSTVGSLTYKDGKLYISAEAIVDCGHEDDNPLHNGDNGSPCPGHFHYSFEEEV